MATTSSNLVTSKAISGQGGNRNNGRYGLKAKLSAGVAILGCAAALVFGGLRAERAAQTQPQSAPQTTLLSVGTDDLATSACIGTVGPFACQTGQSLVGTDDFATSGCVRVPGPFACAVAPTLPGPADFQGKRAVAGVGLREYLDGEAWVEPLPLSSPAGQTVPAFGPQP